MPNTNCDVSEPASVYSFPVLFYLSRKYQAWRASSSQNLHGRHANSDRVNIFGLANDVSILGSAYSLFESTNCNASYAAYPYDPPIEHYTLWREKGFNLFRLPVAWQHLQTSLSAELNATTLQALDTLVDAITGNNDTAIIDVHNYARWYCSIINQQVNSAYINPGGVNVTDEDFIDLWTRIAEHYKHNPNVQFQLMNEPHDLNITIWAMTMQKAIYAVRNVTSLQPILISGTSFARLIDWPMFSGAALLEIHDPADNILYDFHQYFDDLGGAYGPCSLPWSSFEPVFQNVTETLRAAGQNGIITEFGAVPVPDCAEIFAGLLSFLEENQDVWYGWTAWGSWLLNGTPQQLSLNETSMNFALTAVLEKFAPVS